MAYDARIVCDSLSPEGSRLTTMVITFPRIVLAEFNTHRMFSRNSASSRAIPVAKQLERVMQDPFIPTYLGKAQKGMQAHEELSEQARNTALARWLSARDDAVRHAHRLAELGLHKQLTNRLLEPFMWHTVVVTATEWSNFFALRANEMAQPEIRTIAEMMKELRVSNQPQQLQEGEWHLPFIQPDEHDGYFEHTVTARQISAARCARVSYLTHDGKRDLWADIKLYERLVTGGHMSPLEHVATPFTKNEELLRSTLRHGAERSTETLQTSDPAKDSLRFCGNFAGWMQLRKTVANEHDFSLLES
jgi:thymidylate synthase ThyX